MSYLYRPTPVLNPGPPRGIPLSGAVSGGVMLGCDGGVNWKAYFDSARAATQGKPWIVRSGTMGSFVMGPAPYGTGLGQDDGSIDTLPLPDTFPPDLTPLPTPLPVDLYPMPSPIAPPTVPYNPGPVSAAPGIVSSGGSILAPAGTPPWLSVVNSLLSTGTNIARAVTGSGGINPAVPPIPPASVTPNPATALLTQSSMIPGLPNWGVLAGGVAVLVLAASMAGGRRSR